MAKQYTSPIEDPTMVKEDAMPYPHGVTIPIDLPTTGDYSVEYLKKELTNFAMKLLYRSEKEKIRSGVNWRKMTISDRVRSMTLGQSSLSGDTRTDKELLEEALGQKYK